MQTPRFKPQRHVQDSQRGQSRDWKDSRLVVAAVATASTAVFFMTVVLPLRVDLLTAKVERLTDVTANAMATAEKLERVEKHLAEALAAQRLATAKSPFSGRSVYPLGLDLVVLGTPVAELVKRHPDGTWDEDKTYFSVAKSDSEGVTGATYYFDNAGDRRKVNFILFHLKGGDPTVDEILRKHFLTTFGEPNLARRQSALWKATDREWVVIKPYSVLGGSFLIYPPGSTMALSDFDAPGRK